MTSLSGDSITIGAFLVATGQNFVEKVSTRTRNVTRRERLRRTVAETTVVGVTRPAVVLLENGGTAFAVRAATFETEKTDICES